MNSRVFEVLHRVVVCTMGGTHENVLENVPLMAGMRVSQCFQEKIARLVCRRTTHRCIAFMARVEWREEGSDPKGGRGLRAETFFFGVGTHARAAF